MPLLNHSGERFYDFDIRALENGAADLYRFAFNQVCDKQNWKGPIDAVIRWDMANVYMQAVEFMTGVQPTVERIEDMPGLARLTCIGYQAGPCGDH